MGGGAGSNDKLMKAGGGRAGEPLMCLVSGASPPGSESSGLGGVGKAGWRQGGGERCLQDGMF